MKPIKSISKIVSFLLLPWIYFVPYLYWYGSWDENMKDQNSSLETIFLVFFIKWAITHFESGECCLYILPRGWTRVQFPNAKSSVDLNPNYSFCLEDFISINESLFSSSSSESSVLEISSFQITFILFLLFFLRELKLLLFFLCRSPAFFLF